MKYDKILIGFDESRYSMAAVKEVAAWLKMHGGGASIVHGVYFDGEVPETRPSFLRERFHKGEGACYRAQVVAADFGIPMDAAVKEGEPADIIVDTAIENNTDLIALGTYGGKEISRKIMGSVTAKVIAGSPCDVLVVKCSRDDCTGKYEKILVAFDGSPSSRNALKTACAVAKSDGAHVTAFYVIPDYQEMVNLFRTEGINKILIKEAKKILDQAQAIGNEAGVEVDILLDQGYPAGRLTEAANNNNADLIIMGCFGWNEINRTLIGSTAERVIMLAEQPVLVAR